MGHSWPLFSLFSSFQYSVNIIDSKQSLLMAGFEPRISGVGSGTATALISMLLVVLHFPNNVFHRNLTTFERKLECHTSCFYFYFFCLSSTYLCDEDQTPSSQSMTARIICLQRSCHYLEQIVFLDFDRISSLTVLPSGHCNA